MTNVFFITYGGRANNGNTYVPYKAIVHSAEEAIAVINTWKPYGRKNSADNITVNERTAEKIRSLFSDGFGTYPSGEPRTYAGFRTTGCGAWEIGFHPALADSLEEHERIYNGRRKAAKAERMRQAEAAKQRRLAELSEQKPGWYHVALELELMVFATEGNDYIHHTTFEGDTIANSGMDAYGKAVKHVQDNPAELTHRGNMANLQFWANPDSSGFRCTFLGVKTDDGYSVEKWQEKGEWKNLTKNKERKRDMEKMTLQQAEERFGKDIIIKLVNMPAEPTSRVIYPAFEPQHANMDEYVAGSVYVDGGKLKAYYFQPSDADSDDWQFGEMNGIEYGDIEYIEFIED